MITANLPLKASAACVTAVVHVRMVTDTMITVTVEAMTIDADRPACFADLAAQKYVKAETLQNDTQLFEQARAHLLDMHACIGAATAEL